MTPRPKKHVFVDESLGLAVEPRTGRIRKTRAHGVLLVGVRTPAPPLR